MDRRQRISRFYFFYSCPFALSLSKRSFLLREHGRSSERFDKLNANGSRKTEGDDVSPFMFLFLLRALRVLRENLLR